MKNSRSAIAHSGRRFRTKNISKRVQKIVISPIKEMSILADEWQKRNPNRRLISFGQGIPYFDTPSHIKHAIKTALNEPSSAKYTLEPGIPELRRLVAKKYQAGENEIMITAGCQEAMACALATVIDPGDEVLIPSPTFASHIEQILQFNGRPKFVPLNEKSGWLLDIIKFKRAITRKTKAILFSNPANPTGAVLSRQELTDLVTFACDRNLILIADETYDFLTYEGVKHISLAEFKHNKVYHHNNLIICGSFSKKYALTGYRIGYTYAPQGIIDHMLKVHDALVICAPAISQKAAIAALKGKQDCAADFVEKLNINRNLMCHHLDRMSNIFDYQKPQGAYYILARYKKPKINSFKLALQILNHAGVIVIPGAAFGPTGQGCLRFSFAGEPSEIPLGFKRLKQFFKVY